MNGTTDPSRAGGPSLAGRCFVVTGATSGIGREVARQLALRSADLAAVGRNSEKLEGLADELRATGAGAVATYVADLSSLANVRRVAEEILRRHPAVHVLVNNAGAVFARRLRSEDGIEMTWALNVLSPFLLTLLLAPRLRSSSPARVVNVASAAHRGGRLRFADEGSRRRYSAFGTYSTSKLALVLLTYEFARRWRGSGIDVNAVHPGFVRTGFGHNMPGALSTAIRVAGVFALSPRSGARTPLRVAMDGTLTGVSGKYFTREHERRSSRDSYDTRAGARLWEACLRAVGPVPDPMGSAP